MLVRINPLFNGSAKLCGEVRIGDLEVKKRKDMIREVKSSILKNVIKAFVSHWSVGYSEAFVGTHITTTNSVKVALYTRCC